MACDLLGSQSTHLWAGGEFLEQGFPLHRREMDGWEEVSQT